MQAKILRALEEKQFERVGGTQSLHVDVRVVAATNRNLKQRVAERQFREDLFFRLSVFPIQIPPLRERTQDVVILARHFVDRFCRDLNKKPLTLSSAALDELNSYPWPGNVRELQNCIERAVILCDGETIQPRHLNLSFRQPAVAASASSPWEAINLSGTMTEALRRDDGGSRAPQDRKRAQRGRRQPAARGRRAADQLQDAAAEAEGVRHRG